MRFLLTLSFLFLSTVEAKNLFFEDLETYLKTNEYVEYSFDYKKTGTFFNHEGKGQILLRKNGDFVVEVPFDKNSKYLVKYENEMFFELITQEKKHTYTVYENPGNLQIAFMLPAFKAFSQGVTASLSTLSDNFDVKVTHDQALVKAKLDHEMLRSMEIKREGSKTHITFVIKPEANFPRTENVELSVTRSAKAPENAAFKFLLNIPTDATVARVE